MQREAWRIEMLGGLRACQEGKTPIEMSRQQTGTLLAYLALHPDRSHTREELMALIWPEDAPEEARHKLRQSLYALRRQWEPHPPETKDIFLTTRATIQLDPALFTTDVLQFERALRAATRSTDISERIQQLSEAVGLYRGELLPGFYLEALEAERSRLAELYRSALHMLMQTYEQAGKLKRAIEIGRRTLALDPLMEEAHCDLMRLYAAEGQPSAVLRQYQELANVLKEELGEEPSQATRKLMESLRQTAQESAVARGSIIPVAEPPSNDTAISPIVDSNPRPIPILPIPVQPLAVRRRRLLPSLAILSAALCFLLAWQTVGGRNSLSPHTAAPSQVLLSKSNAGNAPSPSLPKGTPNPLPAQPVPSANGVLFPDNKAKAPAPNASKQGDMPSQTAQEPLYHTMRTPPVKRLWIARDEALPGDKSSEAVAVTTDFQDHIYVAGFVDTAAQDVDFVTIKYDADGHLHWQKRYNGPGNDVDRARAIAVDSQGNVYVTGESDNGKGNGTTRLSGTDMATIKYGPDGKPSPTWPDVGFGVGVRRYNGPDDGEERPVRLLVDESGVYVLGRSWGHGKSGKGGFDYVLVKYDRNGIERWAYRYDGGQGDDEPADMARDRDGNFYVTGQSCAEPASGPERDMLTLKVSKEGHWLWEARYGAHNQADDRACSISVDNGGNVYVIGSGRGQSGTPDASRVGCMLVKYDSTGHPLLARGTVQEKDRIETVITAKMYGDKEFIAAGITRNEQGVTVCRIVARDSNGLPRWADDVWSIAGQDGPSAISIVSGIFLCGSRYRPNLDRGFCTFRYDILGNLLWQEFLEVSPGPSFASAITMDDKLLVVVGQAGEGDARHITVVRYQP